MDFLHNISGGLKRIAVTNNSSAGKIGHLG